MRSDPVGANHSHGEGSRTYLIGSDLHLDRSAADTEHIFEQLDEYADEYDCDELLAPGDIADEGALDAFYDTAVETVRIAEGDHDDFDLDDDLRPDGGVQLQRRIDWSLEIGDRTYDLSMSHMSNEYGISTTEMYDNHQGPDVIVYGHGHCPLDRTLDGSLAVSAGSLIQNYNVDDEILAARSAHILEIHEDGIDLTHLDFDTGEELETAQYRWHDGDLEETHRDWTWQDHRLAYVVEGGRSSSMEHWIENN